MIANRVCRNTNSQLSDYVGKMDEDPAYAHMATLAVLGLTNMLIVIRYVIVNNVLLNIWKRDLLNYN